MNRTLLAVAAAVQRVESAAGGFRRQRHGAAGAGGRRGHDSEARLGGDSTSCVAAGDCRDAGCAGVVGDVASVASAAGVGGYSTGNGCRGYKPALHRQARRWCC